MTFEVWDYRTDIRNILVTPQIRARFQRIEVGGLSGGRQAGQGHSHDLGQEVFLVLQGQAEFEIEGETQVVGPGQMCVALVDQAHTVRNVGDEPVILYLSVTPHIQATHTGWTENGEKQPHCFNRSATYDVPPDRDTPTEELLERHLSAIETLVEATEVAREVQHVQGQAFRRALAEGDSTAALEARDAMWDALLGMLQRVFGMADVWNDFTYRTAEEEF